MTDKELSNILQTINKRLGEFEKRFDNFEKRFDNVEVEYPKPSKKLLRSIKEVENGKTIRMDGKDKLSKFLKK